MVLDSKNVFYVNCKIVKKSNIKIPFGRVSQIINVSFISTDGKGELHSIQASIVQNANQS